MESSIQTEERAGSWLARRESGNWSDEDQLQFTQWLNASTANRIAFLRQEAAWEQAVRLNALRGNTPPGTIPSTDEWRLSPFFSSGQSPAQVAPRPRSSSRRRALVYSLAASLIIAVATGVTWQLWPRGPTYSTPIGGIAVVPMVDGSQITLNTDSEIRLIVNEAERRVELQQGEAFFQVAKDPNRPFVVRAGSKRVIAVGTAFSVRREPAGVRVVVTEGEVRIMDGEFEPLGQPASSAHQSPALGRPDHVGDPRDTDRSGQLQRNGVADMLVRAGSLARAGEAGIIVHEHTAAEIEDYLSWRAGYLIFRETPLADAITEFNRYNQQQIYIADPSIAAIRFSGKIRPTSFEAFLRLLEQTYPIETQRHDDRIIITAED